MPKIQKIKRLVKDTNTYIYYSNESDLYEFDTWVVWIDDTELGGTLRVNSYKTEKEAQKITHTLKPENRRACKLYFEV